MSSEKSEVSPAKNVVSKWYSTKEMDKLLDEVKDGDALEFSRGMYSHWGIFVGKMKMDVEVGEGSKLTMNVKHIRSNLELKLDIDFENDPGKMKKHIDIEKGIIHAFIPGKRFFMSTSNIRMTSSFGTLLNPNKAYVDCMELKDVLEDKQVRINNKMSKEYLMRDSTEIIATAIKSMGTFDYNMLFNNCQHFVNICRFGKKISDQADGVLLTSGTVIGVIGTLLTLAVTFLKK